MFMHITSFNLKFSSWQHKKQVREGIIPSCKIHMVEKEETLAKGSKGGGKEELGEEE